MTLNKQQKIFVFCGVGIIVIAAILFYFVIPTTTYYRISITASPIGYLYGSYSSPDIEVKEVDNQGSWEETLEFQRYLADMSRERILKELSEQSEEMSGT